MCLVVLRVVLRVLSDWGCFVDRRFVGLVRRALRGGVPVGVVLRVVRAVRRREGRFWGWRGSGGCVRWFLGVFGGFGGFLWMGEVVVSF